MIEDVCEICKSELISLEKPISLKCEICKHTFESQIRCMDGHFVCDSCIALDTLGYIEKFCKNNIGTNPIDLAQSIMNSPKIKIHGPEHHFLVPAVLISTYYNKTGEVELIPKKLKIARARSKKILPAFCSLYGACGAAIGTGIFLSIVLDCTPFSKSEWSLCGLMTSSSLFEIASDEGPRCCKRVTFHSLRNAIDFIYKHQKVKLDYSEIKCTYQTKNEECIESLCRYHPEYKIL